MSGEASILHVLNEQYQKVGSLELQLAAVEHQRVKNNEMFLDAIRKYIILTGYCYICNRDPYTDHHTEHCPMATYGKDNDENPAD